MLWAACAEFHQHRELNQPGPSIPSSAAPGLAWENLVVSITEWEGAGDSLLHSVALLCSALLQGPGMSRRQENRSCSTRSSCGAELARDMGVARLRSHIPCAC